MKIFKYPFAIQRRATVEIPSGHVLIHAGLDPKGIPCVWAMVDADTPKREVVLYVIGTGHDVPEEAPRHLGSFVREDDVWHIFI
jgi:hypothetical protein